MRSAIYPGTFDPITFGHTDIVCRAAVLFDKVFVAVAAQPGHSKRPLFNLAERESLAQEALQHVDNVTVVSFTGLLAAFAQSCQASAIIRGLRAVSDYEYEFQLAGMNRMLTPEIETVFLPTSAQYTYISSSLVREVAMLGGDVSQFVPAHVEDALKRKIR
jgi:pantetheine-phosphate adenylyltransferase